ncbi:MAG: hypothetical protein V4721_09945 [Bacteroidota bacterium]
MKNTNRNHTDNFFKQGLNSPPEFNPSEKNWKEMEKLLKPEAKRGGMGWIYTISGIAALLLLFLSLWLISDRTSTEKQQPVLVKEADKAEKSDTQSKENLNSVESGNLNPSPGKASMDMLPEIGYESLARARSFSRNDKISGSAQVTTSSADKLIADISLLASSLNEAQYAPFRPSAHGRFASVRNIEKLSPFASTVNTTTATQPESSEVKSSVLPGKWALSLALSPDVNSVKGIDNGQMGMSLGMGVSYRVGKALSLSTGVYYSKKLYSADKTSYKAVEKPFATWTSYSKQIDADCRVIDVPLNISMRLSNKTQNKLYATAGMSSYIMLSEKYEFVYNNPSPAYPTGRREYTVRNENKHLLSVVNLGLALERPLSNQVSLVVQPYAKLPLTGIGQGETDLKSFGLGFKLNYSLKKKKEFGYNRKISTPVAKQE